MTRTENTTVTTLAAEGMARSVDALSEQTHTDFDRILTTIARTGLRFSADDLRDLLDVADIPTRARGGLMVGALARGLIRQVGVVRSTHPATHGKWIGVYVGVQAVDGAA